MCTYLCSVYLSARPRPDFWHPAGFGMRAGERSGGQAVGRLCVSSCCVFHRAVCFIVLDRTVLSINRTVLYRKRQRHRKININRNINRQIKTKTIRQQRNNT